MRCSWAAAVLLAGPFLFLWIVGLPGPVANRLLQRIDSGPFIMTAERIGLSPRGHVVVHRALFYTTNSFAEPLARIDELSIRPRFSALLRGKLEPRTLAIESAMLLFPPWDRSVRGSADHRFILTNITARLHWSADEVRVESVRAHCHALLITADGALARAPSVPSDRRSWDVLADAVNVIRQNQIVLPSIINALAEMKADAAPTLAIHIGSAVTSMHATAKLDGGPFILHGQRIDRITASVGWRAGLLHLENLRVEGPDRLLLEARANAAPPCVIPAGLTGEFAFDRLTLRGVPFANGSGRIASADGVILMRDVQTRIGATGERGEGRAELAWSPSQQTLEGRIDLRLDPNDFQPFLTPNQIRLARRFGFSNEWPHFAGFFRHTTAPTNLYVEGTLNASNFSYRGIHVDVMSAGLLLKNHHVRLDPWRFERPEGVTTGWLHVPLRDRTIRVSLDSSMHPAAIAGMVGPRLHKAVSAWRFDGPVAMRARGVVDASGNEESTDLLLDVDGRGMGCGRWVTEQVAFTLHALHGTYITTNVRGRAYEGDLVAQVRVEPAPAGPEHRFIVQGALTNGNFADMVGESAQAADNPLAGRVNLELQITGLVSDAFGPVTRGGGRLTIQEGAVLRTPLFGGLSDLLSRLAPGLGFVKQTDLSCTFRIGEGAIVSDDIRLDGDIISMRADGAMEFNGEVRMLVEVQLLRRGPLATLLRILTRPVTKLFEFRLTGTLDNPKWRPVNLPKEMFLIFD